MAAFYLRMPKSAAISAARSFRRDGPIVLGFAMLWMLDIKIDYRDGLVNFTVESRFVQ